MKARIKATGEIVNLASYATITLEQCDSWGNPIEMKPEEIELIQEQTKDEYWQEVRVRATIAAMQGLLSNPEFVNIAYNEYSISIEKEAVRYADALVKQLKEK